MPPNEGLDESAGNNGGEHGSGGRGDGENNPGNRGNNRPGANRNPDRYRDGKEFSVAPLAPTRGVPGTGLPNLDDLRRKRPTNPKAADPIPSTRCSHKDPDCASDKRRAAIDAPIDLLAWNNSLQLPAFLANNLSGLISDSEPALDLSRSAQSTAANNSAFYLLPQSSPSTENVVWTNIAGVTASGNNLTKTAGDGWGNAGATSTQAIASGDGYVEFTASDTSTYRMCGLSNGDSSQNYPDIDFAIYPIAGGYLQVFEGGSLRGTFGTYSAGDRLRIAVEGGVVKYYKVISGTPTLLYTSAVSPTYPLSVDTSLYSAGSTVTNAVITNNSTGSPSVTWTNLVGVTASGNSLSKSAADGWGNAGAVSLQAISSGDGYVETTVSEITTYRMFGLSNGDSHQNYTDIDFALYLIPGGYIQVYEGGAYRGQFGTYNAGDHVRVAVEGGLVKYSKNGVILYTSTVAPTYPLLIDTSLYSAGATITNAVISGSGTATNSFSAERVSPNNRTGSGGVDLLSGNANWSLPILGLKGRAGLDLGLSLSYNSLVWTKSQDGTSTKFDADQGRPSPGFRLGFPVIQPIYYNSQTGKNSYLLITPSGGHVDLRQVGTSNVYEAGDFSYLQLIDNGGTLTLKPTDGSQLSFELKNGQYYCTQIKDRNGNFITVSYHADGRINTITDTLARVITFVYDTYSNLTEITQPWVVNGQTVIHKWATFGWSNQTINTSFSGLTVIGPQNNTSIPVLTSVGMGDGTYYKFRYNSWGQIDKVTSYAADSLVNGQMTDTHPLNYTLYTHTPPNPANDCPRVTQTKEWAENWNNNLEAATSYSTAGDYSFGQATMPDGTIHKEMFATTSNWQKGLTTGTESWSGGVKKKWTTTAYTQSNTSLPYRQNPRVTETNVYDVEGNRKRATIDYGAPGGSYEQWNLPYLVKEYAADGVTEVRHSFTDYNLDPAYVNQRIIGLVSARHLSNTSTWQSIVLYSYDAGGTQLVATPNTTIQHDAAYGIGSSPVRGNLTTVTRYDVENINDPSKRAVTQIGYNMNGSVIFSRDPLNHQTDINYADSFFDGINTRNTYAYPTSVTPPLASGESAASFSSTSQYDYHMGAVTRTQGAVPAGQTQGPVQTFEYDSAGRISRVNNTVNNAYRRWVYDPSGSVSIFDTINTTVQEAYSTVVYDGAGRVRATGGDNPNSTGGYHGQFTLYDVMGRASQTSNPAEMNGSWTPSGDDAAGWVWTQQAYDWKGRPTVTTNPDGTTKSATYGGCGCAGGEVVTIRDEMGRQQRVTSDILGRAWKTEVLDWSPSQTVYSTTTNTYNARDQITSVYEQVGSNGTGQTTTLTYDGHGRLKTKRAPSQTADTTYAYHLDDTVQSVTDGRGAVSTFSYNNRHQTTGITYTAPTGITATGAVTLAYDAAGNRTNMTDGSGSVAYQYDQLSRLTSESRQFSGLTGTFTLSYGYNLMGGLTSIADPFGANISYAYDKTGRVTDVTGSSFAGITQYATSIRQRAWGAAKSASYGDSTSLSVSYNSRLLPTDYDVSGLISKDYEYHQDGRLRYSKNNAAERFDRSYTYDKAGRLTEAFSGPLARGQADTDVRPYKMNYSYDALNHLTNRNGRVWSGAGPDEVGSYVSDRNIYWQYDADGRLTSSGETQYTYDAAGRASGITSEEGELTQTQVFDGDGERTMLDNQRVTHHESGPDTTETIKQYFVRSSVLDQVITELNESGQKTRTFVYQGGEVLAWQQKSGSTETMAWEHRDPSYASVRGSGAAAELEPMGMDAGLINPFPLPSSRPPLQKERTYPGFGGIGSGQCQLDYIDTPCDVVQNLMEAGALQFQYSYRGEQGSGEKPKLKPRGAGAAPSIIGWNSVTQDIRSYGLGLFLVDAPVWHEKRAGEGPDWEQHLFSAHGANPQNPNPNCITNAVKGAKGLARPMGTLYNGGLGHDGVHVVAPPGSKVVTLPALTGRVIDIHYEVNEIKGITVAEQVDVMLRDGNVAIYKDLKPGSVRVRKGTHLRPGMVIGQTGGSGDAASYSGLHFTLLNGNQHKAFRDLTSKRKTPDIRPPSMFINPLGAKSKVNCPGVPVDLGGVDPYLGN
jgi:YD repeat-containing protein